MYIERKITFIFHKQINGVFIKNWNSRSLEWWYCSDEACCYKGDNDTSYLKALNSPNYASNDPPFGYFRLQGGHLTQSLLVSLSILLQKCQTSLEEDLGRISSFLNPDWSNEIFIKGWHKANWGLLLRLVTYTSQWISIAEGVDVIQRNMGVRRGGRRWWHQHDWGGTRRVEERGGDILGALMVITSTLARVQWWWMREPGKD